MMKLRAINCKNMGAILVHERKPDGAHTDLVAEVHSGFEDAKHIAECVNAAEKCGAHGFKQLEFEIHGFVDAGPIVAWPEDAAGKLDPTIIQGGVVAVVFENAREQFGVMPDAVWVKPITQDHVADVVNIIEPFGHFKADPLGWTDCEIADAGAVALYDKSAIDALISQRDALLTALRGFVEHGTCFDGDDFERALAAIAMVEGGEASKAFSAPPVL